MLSHIMSVLPIQVMLLLPEILMSLSALVILILGTLLNNKNNFSYRISSNITIVILLVAFIFIFTDQQQLFAEAKSHLIFSNMLRIDAFTQLFKALVIIAGIVVLVMSVSYSKVDSAFSKPEFPVLLLLSIVGMSLMISANDLMSFYLALELQSLVLYVLASINRDDRFSSEAGIKYFILGAFSSAMILYGSSFIYGIAGGTDFATINATLSTYNVIPIVAIVGLVLILVGLCFKISAVPFHMWTPDVYQGVPTPVTAFFAAAPKIATFAFLIRILNDTFGFIENDWQQITVFVSAASMIVGSVGALMQKNIKRLLAYSSIGHIGYALMAVSSYSQLGVQSLIIYLELYLTMTLGIFAVVLLIRKKETDGISSKKSFIEDISELSGLAKTYPLRAAAIAIFMLSMAGIPPLAGFWGKLFVFKAAIASEMYILAVIGVISSVVACFYYLRIIKVMYFDDVKICLVKYSGKGMVLIVVVATLFNLLFFVYPVPFIQGADSASQVLWQVAGNEVKDLALVVLK
ncbi:MAG: NADH-quinone oxidoreductase subunit NuoN [Rickettsiales bacterium]|nr:NADH-quinone oxidoreductase subunit NuoN [Rickettsiales bacterium]